jgi:hypothetical protein
MVPRGALGASWWAAMVGSDGLAIGSVIQRASKAGQ